MKQPLTEQWTLALDGAWSNQDHLQRSITFAPDSPNNPTQSEGFEGQRLANTPEWAGTLRLSYRATADLRLGGSLIHVGDRQGANFGIPFQVDGYTRLDLDASWRVPQVPGLTLFASVENLLDEDYVLGSRDATQIQLGRPQTFTLRARYAF